MATAGIRVEGAKALRSSLTKAGEDLEDLKAAHGEAAGIVAAASRVAVPVRSGRLQASIRPGATKREALIRAGKGSVPYANPIHWGWGRRKIKAQPFISKPAQATETRWTTVYEAAIQEALDRVSGG